ncbi:MAG: energy transducer TonB [Gemmatimonadales bacterium]
MKRVVLIALVMAMAAVAYAAGGGRLGADGLFGWLHRGQRLPALRSQDLPFRFPARLWRAGAEGEVVLRVHITEAGTVDSVLLETSSGHDELDEIALRGARELEYHPALRGEEPVAVWALLPVRFEGRSVTTGGQ